MIRPSSSDTSEAQTNQSIALQADPADRLGVAHMRDAETRVAKTSGAMIILIRRRKMSATTPKYPEIVFALSALAAKVLQR